MEGHNKGEEATGLGMRQLALFFGWLMAIGLGFNTIASSLILYIFVINHRDPFHRDPVNYFTTVVSAKSVGIVASFIGFSLGIALIATAKGKNPTILKFWMVVKSIFILIEGVGIFFFAGVGETQGAIVSTLVCIIGIICLVIVNKLRKEQEATAVYGPLH